MTEHILEAYRIDIETRTNPEGNQRSHAGGWKVNVHEIKPGVIYKDANVTVTAFPTRHAMESYGYRFDTPDRSIVISGDTNPTEETIKACNGCDVLIHEAQTLEWFAKVRPENQAYMAKYHTTTEQLAALATKAKPGLLIVYHSSIAWRPGVVAPSGNELTSAGAFSSSPDVLQKEIGSRYSGHFVIGRDLDVLAKQIAGEKPPARCDLGGPNPAKTKAEVLAYLRDSFSLVDKAIADTSADNLLHPNPGSYWGRNRLSALTAVVWHVSAHYGQLAEYLRMNGIVPAGQPIISPLTRKTSPLARDDAVPKTGRHCEERSRVSS